ncbi:NfeD family protein [Brassicibacter mesophilus]|uniref:NfeD family protein n=1 Tax=Brassicibacter mesophilus TaxID=745119 RepID=UPI003D1EC708
MVISELIANIGLLSAIFFGLGFVFIIIEMFVPGFGVPGALGIAFLVIGIIVTANTVLEALILIMIILAVLGILISVILNSASKGKLSGKIVLSTAMKNEDGYIGTSDMQYFLNKQGTAITVLRPAGTVDFDGVKLDVVSEGDYIAKGAVVKVIKVSGRRIVVRKIDEVKNNNE